MRALLPLAALVATSALYLSLRGFFFRYCRPDYLGPETWALELARVFQDHANTAQGVRELLFVLDLTEIQTNDKTEPAGSRTRLPFADIRLMLDERLVYLDL